MSPAATATSFDDDRTALPAVPSLLVALTPVGFFRGLAAITASLATNGVRELARGEEFLFSSREDERCLAVLAGEVLVSEFHFRFLVRVKKRSYARRCS
jgi:hypothetical protein